MSLYLEIASPKPLLVRCPARLLDPNATETSGPNQSRIDTPNGATASLETL